MAAEYTPASPTSSILAMDSVPSPTSNRSDSKDHSYAKDLPSSPTSTTSTASFPSLDDMSNFDCVCNNGSEQKCWKTTTGEPIRNDISVFFLSRRTQP